MTTIDVDGLFNVRAIGGSAPWIVRSGSSDALTADGSATLRSLGVTRILDLRERSEVRPERSDLPVVAVEIYGETPPSSGRLEDIYEALLRERGGALTAAVGAIADSDGGVLVHCTAGKDRTGLVVALARLVAGESAEEVVRDYALSGPGVRLHREAVAREIVATLDETERAETLRLHLESPAEALRHALTVIDALGGVEVYVRTHGLSAAQSASLRRKHAGAA